MTKKLVLAICIASLVTFPRITPGQTPPPKGRQTVGLVLSGGGARGFAHIGVLKVLEANHIPVDYIGGTSMGGLIGAMYAMGKTPAEIEALVSTLDWGRLLQGSVSFENLSFRRKEDRRNIASPVTLKGKINNLKLPNAFNSGQEIGLLLDRLTLPYANVTDFDRLPIPFRAVGTDMVNGESVTLKSGSLSRSLRATMSIPGVFAPVEVDGRILSDGGLVNNIPTDVVKAMGADILIVINIETQIGNRESLESLPGILAQTINISTLDNSRRSLRQADLIISPDLGPYSLTAFADGPKIIELGQQGAEQKVALLRGLSLPDAEWAQHLARRQSRRQPDVAPTPTYLAVEGENQDSTEIITQKLGDKFTGKPLDSVMLDKLAKDLSELTGTGRFESLDFRLDAGQGKTGLVITSNNIGAKPATPTRLELGVDVNSVESDNGNFNFLARLTFFDVGKNGDEWRNDVRLGANIAIFSEYYRPLGRSKFFVAPRVLYERRRINLFNDITRVAEYVGQTSQAGIDLGYAYDARSELRAGYTIGYQKVTRRIGDPLFANQRGRFSTAGLHWSYDSLDRSQVPTHGVLSKNNLNYYFTAPGASSHFSQAETRSMAFGTYGERNIVFAFGGGGTTFGATAPTMQQFTLGGPFRLGGYGYEQFRGSNYLQGGAGFLHNPKIFPSLLGAKAYLGLWYEGGSVFEKIANASYRQSVSGGAIVETPVGPLFVGGSVNENGRGRFYFSFGRVFR